MAPPKGIEPPTTELRKLSLYPLSYGGEVGALGRIRTYDLLVRSQTLYPAELRARVSEIQDNLSVAACQAPLLFFSSLF